MTSGIYRIRNVLNGDCYIGSAVNFIKRARVHKHLLLKGKHDCIHLQRAVVKYGGQNFVCEPVLVCARKDLIFYEQLVIDAFNPRYNIARRAGNTLGLKFSNEAKAKMRAAKLGRKLSLETIAKIQKSRIRNAKPRPPISEATREKMRFAGLGRSPANKGKRGPSPANKGTGRKFEGKTIPEWGTALGIHKNTLYERVRRMRLTLAQAVAYGR